MQGVPMFSAKWILPVVVASGSLVAQTANDLNGLAVAASRYVASGMAGSHDPQPLELHRISGDNGTPGSGTLMSRATDVQHWTFLYRIDSTLPADASADAKPKPRVAAQAECTKGVFNNFRFSDKPVANAKSLEFTWVAVPLDTAIQDLNANGFIRGFSSVEVLRPDLAQWPDDMVYLFNCPWERREVAISAQTGAMLWSYGY